MDDLISRQAAIDGILAFMPTELRRGAPTAEQVANQIFRTAISCAESYVRTMPSAGPKKGQWLPDNRNYYEERFVCSVCRKSYEVDTCMGEPTWDFCPGCGADMRKGEEQE